MWKKRHGIRNYKEDTIPLVDEGGRSFLSREGAYEFQSRYIGLGDLIAPEEWPRRC